MSEFKNDPLETEMRKSAVLELITEIADGENVDADFATVLNSVKNYVLEHATLGNGPFLTIVIRTQGKRLESLRDALLCLAGQACQDFELILVAHNSTTQAKDAINELLSRQVPSLKKRTKILAIDGGKRARPINVAIAEARGRYLSVFDDDDLVFGHWVESFKKASEGVQGRLLRSMTAIQDALAETWYNSADGYRSLSWPQTAYDADFKLSRHLLVNNSPFMSVAFPREMFAIYGFRFDETLDVCEDWDLILRGSLLFGVTESKELTSIYRLWRGRDSSYTEHSLDQWKASEALISERIEQQHAILSPGEMRRLRVSLGEQQQMEQYAFLFHNGILRRPYAWLISLSGPLFRIVGRLRTFIRKHL